MTPELYAPDGAAVVLRSVELLAALLLVGALPVCALVRPAEESRRGRDGAARRVVLGLRVASVMLLLASAVTFLLLVRAVLDLQPAAGAGAALSQVVASDLGGWTLVRAVVAVVATVVVPAALGGSRPAWAGWTALALVLTVSFPLTGHAGSVGLLAVLLDSAHLVSGAVWLTGVAALALVVPVALRAGRSVQRRDVLLGSASRFSRLAVAAVVVTLVTGLAQAALAGATPATITGSTWGAAVTAKTWLFVLVLAAGLLNHGFLISRLQAARSRDRVQAGSAALLGVVSLEVVLGVAMVLAAALLVSSPQP